MLKILFAVSDSREGYIEKLTEFCTNIEVRPAGSNQTGFFLDCLKNSPIQIIENL
jgi:hypothetical protein